VEREIRRIAVERCGMPQERVVAGFVSHALDPAWSAREAKLYTRAGMGACQGRICGAALQFLMGWSPDSVRPPVQPARLGSFIAEVSHAESIQSGVH
jgi:hypothetical protein